MNERRTTHRLNIELPSVLESLEYEGVPARAVTVNSSGTGVCIVSKEKFEDGKEFLLKIKMPDGEIITIKVKVVWWKEVKGFNGREFLCGIRIEEDMQFEEPKFIKFYADKLVEFFKGNEGQIDQEKKD